MARHTKKHRPYKYFLPLAGFLAAAILFAGGVLYFFPSELHIAAADLLPVVPPKPVLNKTDYNNRMLALANYSLPADASTTPVTALAVSTATTSVRIPGKPWPVETPYPLAGAILPFNRIIAYYGNFYSKGMGVLGEYPRETVIEKLKAAVAEWEAADPSTPVVPAIDYIVITAQGSAGKDGKYRLRMPDSQIDIALSMADEVEGIVILDVQVGLSNLQTELPIYEEYLKKPNVHLAIDPEFAMHNGTPPGRVIGSFDAADINFAANYLAKLVKENDLPPKVLIVHRFTEDMVTGYKRITPLPEVQIVMDMDGWGFGAKKINTYNTVVASEPVQFTGFKIFYKNDMKPPSTRLLTPADVLELQPIPSFIQYQ
jgi:hypothetical protein